MSTETPQRPTRPAQQHPAPSRDPVPAGPLHWLRILLTAVAIAAIFAGIAGVAVVLGHGGGAALLLPAGGAVLGVVMFATVTQPGMYLWLDAKRQARRAAPNAGWRRPAPGPRQPERALLRPAAELPDDFTYIVVGAQKLRPDLLTRLEQVYDERMYGKDRSFFAAVQLVRTIAQEHPNYSEEADLDDAANPFVHLSYLDDLCEYTAAVAALMLVKGDPDIDEDVFNLVMGPWTELCIPYLFDGDKYIPQPDGQVRRVRRPVAGEAAGPPLATLEAYQDSPPPAVAPAVAAPADVVDQPLDTPPAQVTPAPSPARRDPDAIAAASPPKWPYTIGQLADAAELVIVSQFGSVSMVQRKVRVGFGTATAMMDRLAEHGIVRQAEKVAVYDVLEKEADTADVVARWILENEQVRQ